MTAVISGAELYFPLAGLIDIDQEIARLTKEKETLDKEVLRIEETGQRGLCIQSA